MKWLALVNQLLHGQQHKEVCCRGSLFVLLGHNIYIKVQDAIMRKFRNTEIWY